MNDPRVDDQPVSLHQKMNRLCRVDRDCELGFDERSVVAQVDNPGGLAQLERSPQDANHFESNAGASVAERSHGADLQARRRAASLRAAWIIGSN